MSNLDMDKRRKALEAAQLIDEMRELVVYCGIRDTVWDAVIDDLANRKESVIDFVLGFLKELRSGVYTEIHKVWTQPNMTPDMWHNYKILFDRPTLIEQKQMNVCAQKLKIEWKRFKEQLKIEQRPKDGTTQNTIKEAT